MPAALGHLEDALTHNEHAGLAAAHVVQTQVALARLLLRTPSTQADARARLLLSAARHVAQERGCTPLLRDIDSLQKT